MGNQTAQEKLVATEKLLIFMSDELADCHQQEKLEILVLAYHAIAGTHELRRLVSQI